MRKYTNELVMFLGTAIALGGFFPDFRNNTPLVVSVTFSAVCFACFDLISFYDKWFNLQKFLLFAGIFSVIVVPYLSFLTPFLEEQNNFFTLYGLAVVIFLMGLKQKKQEINEFSELKNKFNQQTQIISEQNKIIKEQNQIINFLNTKEKE